ncbi:MAG: hypothetical protein LJU34_01635 [Oscillospiraceae bacterium]|nr:hypothetical protein [Oscillospiraceae bacterium]
MNFKKILAALCCAVVLLAGLPTAVSADTTLEAGKTYELSGSLSCYVNAMGGIDFASTMLSGITVTVDSDGNASMTITIGVSSGTIYSVDYVAFVDASSSTPGYYDASGVRHNASYTTSRNTAINSSGSSVHYVDSITFPISASSLRSSYTLFLYIESNVMGVQFCDGSGSATSSNPGALTPYVARLTVDWGTLKSGPAETSGRYSTVSYTYQGLDDGQFILTIPDRFTLTSGSSLVYQVSLLDAALSDGTGLVITVPDTIEMTSGEDNQQAEIKLSDNTLTTADSVLTGAVLLSVQEKEDVYIGTVDFTVAYVTGAE